MRSRLEPIKAHLPGILAWTRVRISDGALAEMNCKVKVIAHRTYGFRTPKTYITAIYHFATRTARWREQFRERHRATALLCIVVKA